MTELRLEESRWPAGLPAAHRDLLRSILEGARKATGVVGLAAGGSFASGKMDEFSDIDLVVAVEPSAEVARPESRRAFAGSLGPLLAAFPGDHVGEPRLLICLYGPPPVHVDFKFVTLQELARRVEDPVVLWEHDGRLREALGAGAAAYPEPDLQWSEDRFWVWVHYAAAKIGRGELFEALDLLAFLRSRVLGPFSLAEASARPNGLRRLEEAAPPRAGEMRETVARHDPKDCIRALRAAIAMYRDLRDRGGAAHIRVNAGAERAAVDHLDSVEAVLEPTRD